MVEMTQNNNTKTESEDTNDSYCWSTVDEEMDVQCSAIDNPYQNNTDGCRIQLNMPNLAKSPLSHISSVAFQNSTDITFGNKTLYSGPITVNQFGVDQIGEVARTEPLSKRHKVLSTVLIILAAFVSATVLLGFLFTLHFEDAKTETGVIDIDNDHSELTLVTRDRWKAKKATGEINDLKTPVRLVIVQHTVQSSCNTMNACATLVRQVQSQHINSRYIDDDIGYNFLVGGDGAVYEGRGWDKVGAHTYGYNSRSIGIAFIGDYRTDEPTTQQIIALLKLLRDGVTMHKISENYTLLGANQVQQTESPGRNLYHILVQLPHWSDDVDAFE
ncbi:Peptidoglycan recognition protein [Pseudolycoriella hygida]|uniref:Peptidoglycan recognition protein n=1 Tax=Pseudolycoriella hygida TaxID=35572 RepID=A0A9Q0N1D3_9DIPT|nr:Peptidoglycan recognition protein [Pseudolycoriella hygida]